MSQEKVQIRNCFNSCIAVRFLFEDWIDQWNTAFIRLYRVQHYSEYSSIISSISVLLHPLVLLNNSLLSMDSMAQLLYLLQAISISNKKGKKKKKKKQEDVLSVSWKQMKTEKNDTADCARETRRESVPICSRHEKLRFISGKYTRPQ